jgi:alpha-L-fucosidase
MENYEHLEKDEENLAPLRWYTTNATHRSYWLSVMKEIIDLYVPDLLYSDGGLPFAYEHDGAFGNKAQTNDPDYQYGLEVVSCLYNKSSEKYGRNHAVYTQKDRREEIYSVGVLDIEKSQLPEIKAKPWQTDTCIGNWFYDAKQQYKKPKHIIEILIDVVSKNGTMLLNILQLPDGSIDDEAEYILEELASWTGICGNGIYGTRPWRIFGEGLSSAHTQEFFREDAVAWTEFDYRFTAKDKTVFAFIMEAPLNRVSVIRSFKSTEIVSSVKLLGHGDLPFSQHYGVLTVKLPETLPTLYSNCLAIELEK